LLAEIGELLSSCTIGDSVDKTGVSEGLRVSSDIKEGANVTKEGVNVEVAFLSTLSTTSPTLSTTSPHGRSPQHHVPSGQSGSPSLHVTAVAQLAERSSKLFAQ
jgi:hypothetical protein